jgi:hypothetical protein
MRTKSKCESITIKESSYHLIRANLKYAVLRTNRRTFMPSELGFFASNDSDSVNLKEIQSPKTIQLFV